MTGIIYIGATAVTREWNGYRNESAQKVGTRGENSPVVPAGSRTCDLSITSPTLTAEQSLLPILSREVYWRVAVRQ